jgi:hypothetical protein
MRWIVLILVATVAAGCGAEERASSGSLAQLTVRLDADGPGPDKAREVKVTCDAAGDSEACGAAAGLKPSDFAAVPSGRVCTDIFGGPETASVSGELRGESVNGEFKRQNGCEIKRWKAIAGLLP